MKIILNGKMGCEKNKELAYNDGQTDGKILFNGESMRPITLFCTLLNQILRESEHFRIHTEKRAGFCYFLRGSSGEGSC